MTVSHRHSPSFRIEGALIVLFWVCIFLLTVGQRAIDPRGGQGIALPGLLHAGAEYAFWLLLTPGVFWLSRRFSLERGSWPRRLLLHAVVALIVALVVDAMDRHLYVTLVRGSDPFPLLHGLAGLRFLDELIIYFVILAAGFARDYFLRYRERLEEAATLRTHAAELQAQLAEAHLHALRMQINPHFLFNTLHTISTYLERDPRGARRMIARLSELLRYALEMGSEKEVTLARELGFLDGYLEIQSIRFADSLEVRRDIDPVVLEALVPTLILQPLVENAVQHGVGAIEGDGVIELRAWRERDELHLTVRDNGPGLSPSTSDGAGPEARGIGLRNTTERLRTLYGREQALTLEPADGEGLVAHIMLPYHTASDLYTSVV